MMSFFGSFECLLASLVFSSVDPPVLAEKVCAVLYGGGEQERTGEGYTGHYDGDGQCQYH